jgi:hypothetical protein
MAEHIVEEKKILRCVLVIKVVKFRQADLLADPSDLTPTKWHSLHDLAAE